MNEREEKLIKLEQELAELGVNTFVYNPRIEELVDEIFQLKQEMEKSQEE